MFVAALIAAVTEIHPLYLLGSSTPNPTPAPASSSPVSFDFVGTILQYGLLGVLVLCFAFRKFLVPEWTLKQAEERHQKEIHDLQQRLQEARDQVAKLQDVFQDQMIPVLTRATEVNARYIDEMKRARYRRGSSKSNDEIDEEEA